ncbi:MAG: hypothetical protein RI573_08280 [Balneolaceae bacterium]|nr:hypothetical protein [Balneolaceae bacterium]
MKSPVDFKGYQILKINYVTSPVEEGLPIDGSIPDPEPDIRVNPDNKNKFAVILNSKIIPETDKEDHQCPLELEFEVLGHFELTRDLDEEERIFHMAVSAPSMLYGIVRSWVSQLTSNSEIGTIMLPSVQFADLGEEKDESKEKEGASKSTEK